MGGKYDKLKNNIIHQLFHLHKMKILPYSIRFHCYYSFFVTIYTLFLLQNLLHCRMRCLRTCPCYNRSSEETATTRIIRRTIRITTIRITIDTRIRTTATTGIGMIKETW